jgi:predicted GIY-YIG superfamily endonuclease
MRKQRTEFDREKAEELRRQGFTVKEIAKQINSAEITCFKNLKETQVNKHFKELKDMEIVYEFYNKDGICIYIGQSKSFHRRLIQHKSKSNWYSEISTITCYVMDSFPDMAFMEAQLIIQKQPKYNDRIIKSKESKFIIDYNNKINYNIYGVKIN